MKSLVNMIQIVSGDSSDLYYFSSPDFPDFSSADWEGSATIRSNDINGAEVISVPLLKNDGSDGSDIGSKFIFKLQPQDSAQVKGGTYSIAIEIKNLALGFRREIVQAILLVSPSGVSN